MLQEEKRPVYMLKWRVLFHSTLFTNEYSCWCKCELLKLCIIYDNAHVSLCQRVKSITCQNGKMLNGAIHVRALYQELCVIFSCFLGVKHLFDRAMHILEEEGRFAFKYETNVTFSEQYY